MHHASWTIFNQPPMTCPSITSMAATTRGNDSHPNDGDGLETHPGMFFFYFVFFSTNSLKVDYVYGTSNDNEVITTTITATNTWNGEQGLEMLMHLERQVCFFHLFFFSSTNYLWLEEQQPIFQQQHWQKQRPLPVIIFKHRNDEALLPQWCRWTTSTWRRWWWGTSNKTGLVDVTGIWVLGMFFFSFVTCFFY